MITHIIESIVLAVAMWSSWHTIGNLAHGIVLGPGPDQVSRLAMASTGTRIASILWATFYFMTQWPL